MQKLILGLITATMFSGVSAQACIGSLNVEERRAIQAEILESVQSSLGGKIIGGLLSVNKSESIGIRGNCQAVHMVRIDNAIYSRNIAGKTYVCSATVATEYNKGMIGAEDSIDHIIARGECDQISKD